MNRLARLAGRASHRSVLTLLGWAAIVTAVSFAGGVVGTLRMNAQQLEVGGSAEAQAMLARAGFPNRASEHILVSSRRDTVSTPDFRTAIHELAAALVGLPGVVGVRSPVGPHSPLVAEGVRCVG